MKEAAPLNIRRIFHQSLHSGLFFVLNYGSRLLLAIALGKALSVQEYGIYSLIGMVVATSTSLFPLGVTQYYVREIPGVPLRSAMKIFKSVIGIQMVFLLAAIASVLAIPALREPFNRWLGIGGLPMFALLVAGLLIGENLAADFGRFLFFRGEIQRGNVVSFLQYGLWAYAAFALFLFAPHAMTLKNVLLLWTLSLAAAALYGFFRVGPRALWEAPIEPGIYRTALRFGFPLLTASTLAVANTVGRFVLANSHSAHLVGIFTYQFNIVLMIGAISAPLIGNPIDPYAIEAYNVGHTERCRYLLGASLRYRMALVIPFLIVASIWSEPLIRLLAKREYMAGGWLLASLTPLPLLAILGNTFERVLFLERRTGTIGRCYLIAAAVQIGITFWLVPQHPYKGMVLASLAGGGGLTGMLWYHARKTKMAVDTALGRLLPSTVCALAVACAAAKLLPGGRPFNVLAAATLIVCAAYALFAYLYRVLSQSEIKKLKDLIGRQMQGVAVERSS